MAGHALIAAYYNEIDPFAAQWLRNLIAAGHIAPGIVDTRPIKEVRADDIRAFTQHHFFAGIGVWSHALRLAGWPDSRPVCTGSCPCQPFSSAGQRGGFADERHLWPDWFRVVAELAPRTLFGEQVGSPDGLAWLDAVSTDLEGAGYAVGAVDTCAAGFGAPHIRQRLYFAGERLADPERDTAGAGRAAVEPREGDAAANAGSHAQSGRCGDSCGVADTASQRRTGVDSLLWTKAAWWRGTQAVPEIARSGEPHWLGDASGARAGRDARAILGAQGGTERGLRSELDRIVAPGPVNGFWFDAEWLPCIDGKWRPAQSGAFPLAHGSPARVGRLRAYGNAIVAPQAAAFIAAYMACRP